MCIRDSINTLASFFKNSKASASPKPLAPPVTIIFLFLKSKNYLNIFKSKIIYVELIFYLILIKLKLIMNQILVTLKGNIRSTRNY